MIETSTVISSASGIVAFMLAAYVALARIAYSTARDADVRRIAELEKGHQALTVENRMLSDRLHATELVNVKAQGEINLVRQNHDSLSSDLEEIKQSMVTKDEWEPRMTNLDRIVNQILAELRGSRHPNQGAISYPPRKT